MNTVHKVPGNILKQNCFVRECVDDVPVCSLHGNSYVSVDVVVDPTTGDSKLEYSTQAYPITPDYVKSFYTDYRTNLDEETARLAPGKNLGDLTSVADFLKNIANPEFVSHVNGILSSLKQSKAGKDVKAADVNKIKENKIDGVSKNE